MLVAGRLSIHLEAVLDDEAEKFGQDLRSTLVDGGELHAYIDCAHGDEPIETIYGRQDWRLEKLRRLKSVYDLEDKFVIYSPIE
jgi:hypothetical protein